MEFKILTDSLLDKFLKGFETSVLEKLSAQEKEALPVDYFQSDSYRIYKSVSSVYSSKIEGEDIEFDSYFKHKFLKVKFKPDYTRFLANDSENVDGLKIYSLFFIRKLLLPSV